MKYHTFEFKGKKINYQSEYKYGYDSFLKEDVPTLVLLHGFMNDLQVWQSIVLRYMDKGLRVVCVDLIGHGESECFDEPSTMELQAQMIKELLDSLNIGQVVMCGHSMGGMITLAFAELYPQRLKGFCLMNSSATSDNEKSRANRLKACELIDSDRLKYIVNFIPNLFAEQNREKFSDKIDVLKQIAVNTPKEGIILAQKGMILRKDRCFVLSQAQCPVLFIDGKYDVRIDINNIYSQAALVQHSETLVLPTGHMSFIEQENIVSRRLYEFTVDCFSC